MRRKPNSFIEFLCYFILSVCVVSLCPRLSYSQISEINEITQQYKDKWEQGHYRDALEILESLIDSREDLERIKAYRYLQWLDDRSQLKFLTGDIDGAIEDMEVLANRVREPASTLRLAQFHQYKGEMDRSNELLDRAMTEAQFRWYFYYRGDNVAAIAKVSELQGENPKVLLSSFYSNLIESFPSFQKGYVGAGELALSKGDYALAEDYFVQALALHEKNQNALAGLAECYLASGDPRAQKTITDLLEINPMNYKGNALLIARQLESGEEEEALARINQVLAVNPNQLEVLSLKASAHFLRDEFEEMESTQKRILNFNPVYSGAYRAVGEMATQKYRFQEAAEWQKKALEINPDDLEARELYAMALMRLGKADAGKEQLDIVFEKDPFNVQVYNMLELLDTLKTYQTIEAGPFVIKMPKQETPFLEDEVISLLMNAYKTYQKKYEIELETPVYIEIFDHHDDFMVRSVGLPGSIGFMGICFGHLVTMDSPTARPKHSMNWRSVLWHEFVHVITLQKTNNRMPRWLSEGISVYEETEYSKAFGQKLDPSYKAIIDRDDLPGMVELELMFTQPKTSNHIQLGYFLSGEFARFYVDAYGMGALNSALDAIGMGKKTPKALADGAEKTVDEVNGAFHEYLINRLSILDNIPDVPEEDHENKDVMEIVERHREQQTSWFDLDSPFTNTMKTALTAMEDEQWKEAETLLQEAHELFPELTGSMSPLVLLAGVYEQSDQPGKREETLWKIMDYEPAYYPAGKKLIGLLIQDEEWEKIARVCDWAIGIDPFDEEILNLYQRALDHTGNYSKAADVVKKRIYLEPQYAIEHRMERVSLLRKAEEKNKAKKELLELLEEYPHYWEGQKSLLEITGKLY